MSRREGAAGGGGQANSGCKVGEEVRRQGGEGARARSGGGRVSWEDRRARDRQASGQVAQRGKGGRGARG